MIDSTQKYLPFPLFLMSLVIVGGGMWYILRITNTPIPQPISINEVAVTTDQESSLFGDINKDKGVNLLDYNIFVSEFGKSGYSSADLDKSGQVNLIDFALFTDNYGRTSP